AHVYTRRHAAAFAVISGVFWLFCTVASAQTTASAAPQSQDVAQNQTVPDELQEVTVSAERRAADTQNTPITIYPQTGAELAELHLDTISSLQNKIPAFTSADSSGLFSAINIRGIGNSSINPAITVGVAVFRDGVLMGETIGQNEALYDIHDISVLEGPQGTFVGASST